jgi:hypothetical protein
MTWPFAGFAPVMLHSLDMVASVSVKSRQNGRLCLPSQGDNWRVGMHVQPEADISIAVIHDRAKRSRTARRSEVVNNCAAGGSGNGSLGPASILRVDLPGSMSATRTSSSQSAPAAFGVPAFPRLLWLHSRFREMHGAGRPADSSVFAIRRLPGGRR